MIIRQVEIFQFLRIFQQSLVKCLEHIARQIKLLKLAHWLKDLGSKGSNLIIGKIKFFDDVIVFKEVSRYLHQHVVVELFERVDIMLDIIVLIM